MIMVRQRSSSFGGLSGLVLICLILGSCSASRYIGHRLAPDRAPIEGRRFVGLPQLTKNVTILLDTYGVPHIKAGDEYSLYFAYGYIEGRDRRFQMEVLRKISAGRLREMFGDLDSSGLLRKKEIQSRMIGFYRDAEVILAQASPADRRLLQAFADGVNAATEREPRPMEFRLLDYQPQPWQPQDSCLIIALTSFGLCKNWEMELGRLELIVYQLQTGGSIERALAIWPPRAEWGPHLIGTQPERDPFAAIAPLAPELASYLQQHFSGRQALAPTVPPNPGLASAIEPSLPAFANLLTNWSASNNWAMNREWTKTGQGAFSSDPHMPHMIPALGYLAHLKCENCSEGDYEAIGAGFAGLPAIAFGSNGKTAWGPTSNWADVTDIYVEQPISGQPGYYRYEDGRAPFLERTETFQIRQKDGSFKNERMVVRETRHGVVLNDFLEKLPKDFPIVTLRREMRPQQPISALRQLYLSDTVTEARAALNDFAVLVGHWSLADHHGNVGYAGPLSLPIRRNHLGTLPVPGWLQKYEWAGFYPIAQLPFIENPPSGWVASANNQVVQPESFGLPINFEGDVPFRYQRIADILNTGRTHDTIVNQIGQQQTDNVDLGWSRVQSLFSPALQALLTDPDPLLVAATRTLLAWDGHSSPDSVGASLFNVLTAYLLKNSMADEVSPATLKFLLTYFNAEPLTYGIFTNSHNPAWDDRKTEVRETAAAVIQHSFRETVAGLRQTYGGDISGWIWDKIAPWVLEHPFGQKSALASYVNRKAPMNGSINTLYKHQYERTELTRLPNKIGPVLRIMVDFNDFSASKMSLPGGQSGRPASKHYDDLLPLFLRGDGIPMSLDFPGLESSAVGRITLGPGH
jgi:penicillin amidase